MTLLDPAFWNICKNSDLCTSWKWRMTLRTILQPFVGTMPLFDKQMNAEMTFLKFFVIYRWNNSEFPNIWRWKWRSRTSTIWLQFDCHTHLVDLQLHTKTKKRPCVRRQTVNCNIFECQRCSQVRSRNWPLELVKFKCMYANRKRIKYFLFDSNSNEC